MGDKFNEDGTPKTSVPTLKKSDQGGLIKDMSNRIKKGSNKSLGRAIIDDAWNLGSAAVGVVGEGLMSGNKAGSSLPQFPKLGTPDAYRRAEAREMGGLRRKFMGESNDFNSPDSVSRSAYGASRPHSDFIDRGSSNASHPLFPYQNPSSGALSGSPAYRQGAVGLPPAQPYEAPLISNPSYNPSLGSALPLPFDASPGSSPADNTFYDPSQGDQLQQGSNPRARILNPMRSAATKREADLKANYATSDLTVDSKRASRAEAATQRRAETQSRQLSRDTNMAYREAIRRGDRAGALRVRQGAIDDGVTFGGIRQHGDVGRQVAAQRQNAITDAQGRLDAMAAARKGVPGFQGGSRPSVGVQPLSSVIDSVGQPAGGAYYNPNQHQTYGPDRKAVASSHDVVKRKVPNSLALKQSKTPL
jgi:hypothetical protein